MCRRRLMRKNRSRIFRSRTNYCYYYYTFPFPYNHLRYHQKRRTLYTSDIQTLIGGREVGDDEEPTRCCSQPVAAVNRNLARRSRGEGLEAGSMRTRGLPKRP